MNSLASAWQAGSTSEQALVELDDLACGYEGNPVLERISLSLYPGQFAGIVGPSGSGKTTVLRAMLGMAEVFHGAVRFPGAGERGRVRIGYVPQLETIDWSFPVTVEQVVLMGLAAESGWFPWARKADRVKMHELLERSGTAVPYRTLARFAAEECGYSSSSRHHVTVPVADGKPGEEVQLDFGYLGMIADGDRRRKLHALVFTAVVSRYCFVYLTFSQTTAAVIAGCEAAWAFFGGMFTVLVADNLKPVVDKADRLEPRWNREWLEYAQARGLVVDPARVRCPQDKGRVENGVKFA